MERRRGGASVQAARARRALFAVVACMAALLLACCAGEAVQDEATRREAEVREVRTSALWTQVLSLDASSQDGGLRDLLLSTGFVALDESTAPPWFEGEVAPTSLLHDGLATADWSTLEFSLPGAADLALGELDARLLGRGWLKCESGVPGIASYVKEGGLCTWMMVSWTESEGSTRFVMSIPRTEAR